CVNVAHYAVIGGRLSPTLVSPISRAAVHGGEEAGYSTARSIKRRTGVCAGPGRSAIGRPEKMVIARRRTGRLGHARNVYVARERIARDLHVANKGRR